MRYFGRAPDRDRRRRRRRDPHRLHRATAATSSGCPPTARSRCGTRIFEAGCAFGIFPAGIGALDVARVEAGLILIEAEYTSARHAIAPEQSYSPFELGLGRLVDFGKAADFNGRRALLGEQRAGGPARRLVGLELDWAGIEGMFAKHGLAPRSRPFVDRAPVPVYKDNTQVGRATSISWGTDHQEDGRLRLDRQATSRSPAPRVGRVTRRGRARQGRATVVPLPFLDLQRKRT